MFLTQEDISSTFPQLALEHYNKLFLMRFRRMIDVKISLLGNSKLQRSFFIDLKKNNYKLLKQIMLCKIQNFKNLQRSLRKYPSFKKRESKSHPKKFGDHVDDLFSYAWFTTKPKNALNYNAYSLAEALNINTCLYCNRSYTVTLIDNSGGKVRPEFDHFLPKSKFPYLALSFYNLIPSCHICNSNLKLDKQFNANNYLHPYRHCFDELLKFTIVFNDERVKHRKLSSYSDLINLIHGDLKSFSISLVAKQGSSRSSVARAMENASVFHIEDLYNYHKDLVTEMIQSAIIYDESTINSIYQKFAGKLFRDRSDVLRFVTKNYPVGLQMNGRPFTKLSRDIHKEFGIKY